MAATKPKFGSALDGCWGSAGSMHVNYIGSGDHVHELYIALGASRVDNDLTESAGAVAPGNAVLTRVVVCNQPTAQGESGLIVVAWLGLSHHEGAGVAPQPAARAVRIATVVGCGDGQRARDAAG